MRQKGVHLRAQLSAAPLKLVRGRGTAIFQRDLRAQLSAAPLKQRADGLRIHERGDLRAQLSAAPLKHLLFVMTDGDEPPTSALN